MAYYLDTSAFLKLVVTERETAALRSWIAASNSQFVASDLLRTEALRAARRHSPEALLQARTVMEALVLMPLMTDLCERAAGLDPSILRSLDALHLASALALGDDLEGVITYDDRLKAACAAHGVRVASPD